MPKFLSIKFFVPFLLLFFSSGFIFDDDDDTINDSVQVTRTNNLSTLSQQAAKHRMPILIEFSSESCPYCEILEENILKPMIRSGDYRNRILIRKIDISDYDELIDWQGNTTTSSALAAQYNIWVTPTVILVDYLGREIAERQVGINSVEFYGAYLDNEIDLAVKRAQDYPRKNHPSAPAPD